MTWSFQLDIWSALRLALTLTALFTIPGGLILSFSPLWQRWPALNRWLLAVAISIAFYPAVYYGLAFLAPSLALTQPVWLAGLAIGGAWSAWRWRSSWRAQIRFNGLEWLALAVLFATMATRFWVIRDWPFPASPDSLHHSLITGLTTEAGRLPVSLEPYAPVPLDMYHLGLHALASATQTIADVPAHAALLWVAQVLNGLCGIGVYLWLDRRAGRLAAVVGLITAGLLSFQPALLTSWGRFTPLGSQAILLVAIWLIEIALEEWRKPGPPQPAYWALAVAGLLIASVYLIHFRVAGYLLPILTVVIVRAGLQARSERQVGRLAAGVTLAAGVAVVIALPALIPSLKAYYLKALDYETPERRAVVEMLFTTYFPFTLELVNMAGMRNWLLALSALAIAVGLWKGLSITRDVLIWLGVLWLMGNAYLLRIPVLQFTNMTAILLMLYLPAGVLIGAAAEAVAAARPQWRRPVTATILVIFCAGGLVSGRGRALDYIPQYQFVRAEDIAAMNWIAAHTPPDAVFAVNTLYAHPESLFGTDAGYWIPYFAQRRTTAGSMMFTLGPAAYREQVAIGAQTVKALERHEVGLDALRALGVAYVYVGKAGNPINGPGFDLAWLRIQPGAQVVYEADGVGVVDIRSIPAP